MSRRRDPSDGERGFVLVATIWLLVLAGSIVAMLMLRTFTMARAVSTEQRLLESDVAAQSAIETVLADRLFVGARSHWWMLPAEGTVRVGGRDVRMRLTSEGGRLDLNEADPGRIDAALRGLGLSATGREAVLASLRERRRSQRRVRSLAEMRGLFSGPETALPSDICIDDLVTFASGRPEPSPATMPARLAAALGVAAPPSPGSGETDALRIEAEPVVAGQRRVTRAVARVTVTGVLAQSFERSAACSPLSGAANN